MGTVFRKTVTKPLPAGAKIITRKGERLAEWKDVAGKRRTAPVTTGKAGADRIVITARTFTAKYRNGSNHVVEVRTGCRDETAAKAVLHELELRADKVRSKMRTADEDAVVDNLDTALSVHVAAFLEHQEARDITKTQMNDTRTRLSRIAADCRFKQLSDLNATALERWLVARQAEGMSARTRNCYRQAWVTFGNWCVRNQRLLSNPFASVPKADEKSDPRRKRRSLDEDELTRLLAVAMLRPLAELGRLSVQKGEGERRRQRDTWNWKRLTFEELAPAVERARERLRDNPNLIAKLEHRGRERALIYKTLVLTGLRKGELASLRVRSLDLDSDPAFLTLNAADEKNREGNSLPLRSDLAAELRAWLADKASAFQDAASDAPTVLFDPQAVNPSKCVTGDFRGRNGQSCQDWTSLPAETPLFDVPAGLLRILNRDLRAAGIPKRDERGRTIDVHGLRTTFGTLLSKAGVHPRTAQSAMRHSDIGLTMNTYTDPKLLDVAGAVEALPALPALPLGSDQGRDRLAATGTEHGILDARQFAPKFAPTSVKSGTRGSNPVKMASLGTDPKKCENPRIPQGNQGFPGVSASRGAEIRTRDLLLPKQAR